MKSSRRKHLRSAIAAIVATVSLASPAVTHAGKPGGGGGSVPAGTLYFNLVPRGEPGVNHSMRGDGSQKTPLAVTGFGSPSALTHVGQRWFLQKQPVGGLDLAGQDRWEVFAVREDNASSVQLTDDPALSVNLDWTPSETESGAILAGIGRRFNVDGSVDPGSVGIYAAALSFDAAGNVIGLDGPPAFLVSIGVSAPGSSLADVYGGFSFSPDLSHLVVDHYYLGNGLRIINVGTGAETPLVGGSANSPTWSPDGTRIVFRMPGAIYESIEAISPDGSGRATLFKGGGNRVSYNFNPTWSPDSAYVAFEFTAYLGGELDIYRVPAKGGNAVNLTAEFDRTTQAYLLGWR